MRTLDYTGGREYRIWRTARKRHECAIRGAYCPFVIEPGQRYSEYLQMPGHDYNMGTKAPWRIRVCATCSWDA